jgi:hypothetical protein
MGRIETPVRHDGPERTKSMFRKIAVALIATSIIVAPALAAESMKTKPASATTVGAKADTKAPTAAKAAVPAKVIKKHRSIRHRVYAGKHRKHVKHAMTTKRSVKHKAVTTNAKVHRVVKTKKLRVKKHAAAAVKSAPRPAVY